jgi:hypothetical protein
MESVCSLTWQMCKDKWQLKTPPGSQEGFVWWQSWLVNHSIWSGRLQKFERVQKNRLICFILWQDFLSLACWRFINIVTALMAKVLLLGNPNQWYPTGTGFMAVINSLWTANSRQAGCLKNGATRTRYHTKFKRRWLIVDWKTIGCMTSDIHFPVFTWRTKVIWNLCRSFSDTLNIKIQSYTRTFEKTICRKKLRELK